MINDGFTIISDLSGAIIKETIHINGTAYNGHCRSYVLSELKNISPDISFYGYKTAEKYIVKTKGDAGDDDQFDCYWYGLVECRNCGCVYYANVLQNRSCPHCGEDVLNGMLVCNTCGNPIDDCICGYNPDDPYCNECHRLKENCICGKDDENLPDNPEPNLCGICGLPVGTCQHTQEK